MPLFISAGVTVTGFFSPSLAMLATIWANFFLPRSRGFSTVICFTGKFDTIYGVTVPLLKDIAHRYNIVPSRRPEETARALREDGLLIPQPAGAFVHSTSFETS